MAGLVLFRSVLLTVALFAAVTMTYHAAWILTVYSLFRFSRLPLLSLAGRFLGLAAGAGAALWIPRGLGASGIAVSVLIIGAYYVWAIWSTGMFTSLWQRRAAAAGAA